MRMPRFSDGSAASFFDEETKSTLSLHILAFEKFNYQFRVLLEREQARIKREMIILRASPIFPGHLKNISFPHLVGFVYHPARLFFSLHTVNLHHALDAK